VPDLKTLTIFPPAIQQMLDNDAECLSTEYSPRFYHCSEGYRIRYAGLVDFILFEGSDKVSAYPTLGTSAGTVRYLFRHQILPLQYSRFGEVVLHGSAVASSSGALVFAAASGSGKSTLATYLAMQGYALIGDDIAWLQVERGRTILRPGAPAVRLWDDSLDVLELRPDSSQPGGEYTDKFFVEDAFNVAVAQRPEELSGVYLLGDNQVAEPVLEPVTGSDALTQLIRHSYAIPIGGKKLHSRHFLQLGKMLDGVPVWRLEYPRTYEALPAVAALLPAGI
jgi:hypothetical protein